jgi:hypothetical protein
LLDDGSNDFKVGGMKLEPYILSKLQPNTFPYEDGEVIVQLLVNKKGRTCCKSVSSTRYTVSQLKKLHLDKITDLTVDSVTATIDGKKWDYAVVLKISKAKGSLLVQRLTF